MRRIRALLLPLSVVLGCARLPLTRALPRYLNSASIGCGSS